MRPSNAIVLVAVAAAAASGCSGPCIKRPAKEPANAPAPQFTWAVLVGAPGAAPEFRRLTLNSLDDWHVVVDGNATFTVAAGVRDDQRGVTSLWVGRVGSSQFDGDGSYKLCLDKDVKYTRQVLTPVALAAWELPPVASAARACSSDEVATSHSLEIRYVTPAAFACPDPRDANVGDWRMVLQAWWTDGLGRLHSSQKLFVRGQVKLGPAG